MDSFSLLLIILIPLLIFIFLLSFLVKRFPDYFPRRIVFNLKSFFIFILDIVLLYLIIFSYELGSSSGFIENSAQCYRVVIVYHSSVSRNIICSKMLNDIPQINFLVFGVVTLIIFVTINYLFLRRNADLKKVLFTNVDLLKDKKEGKMRKWFLPITLIITFIVIIIGYIFFSHL